MKWILWGALKTSTRSFANAGVGFGPFQKTDSKKLKLQKLGLSETQKEFKKRNSDLQIHLAELEAIRAEADAWKRLTKLKRSARREEEPSQTWKAFLDNHPNEVVSIEPWSIDPTAPHARRP